ncbi:hypothetical protein HK405_012705, partial [Cladochytrium tenue]
MVDTSQPSAQQQEQVEVNDAASSHDVPKTQKNKTKRSRQLQRGFIDRTKAVSFQLVHRSQRDPALADDSASRMVLREMNPNLNLIRKGIELPTALDAVPDLEATGFGEYRFDDSDDDDDFENDNMDDDGSVSRRSDSASATSSSRRQRNHAAVVVSRADRSGATPREDPSMHGVFFSENDGYDYMQHLKPIGEDPSAVFVGTGATAARPGISFKDDAVSVAMSQTPRRHVKFDIPAESLPSQFETRVGLMNQGATIEVLDVEPEMREVIYALEDEEYVEDDVDDFFAALDAEEVPQSLDLIPDGEYVPPKKGAGDNEDDESDEDEDEDEDEDVPSWLE